MGLLQVVLLLVLLAGPIDEHDYDELRRYRVYISGNDSAQCNGEVYGWRICPVPSEDDFDESFHVVLAMYHEDLNSMVQGSYIELNLITAEDVFEEECFDYMLEPSQYFNVKYGDLVAACWYSDNNRLELAVLDDEKYLIRIYVDSCSENSFQNFQFSIRYEYYITLRLSAYINVDECRRGEHSCHDKAICSDVIGADDSYNCTCESGYTGDGYSCLRLNNDEVDEEGTEDNGGIDEEGTEDSSTTVVKETPTIESTPQENNKQETGGIIGATVAAIVLVFLIITLTSILIVLYISRQHLQRVLVNIPISRDKRDCTKKVIDTLTAGGTSEQVTPHDYDYVGADLQQQDINHYEVVALQNTTPTPAMTEIPINEYEVPLSSKNVKMTEVDRQAGSLDQPYELMISSGSVRLEGAGGRSATEKYNDYASLIQQTVQENVYEALSPYQAPASKQESLYAQMRTYNIVNIPRENLEVHYLLGTGQFGSVSKGVWIIGSEKQDVAVKTLTDSANTVKFLQEAAIMAQFKHPNILTLHGVVSVGDPILVVEIMHNGDLKSVLCKMRPTSEQPVMDNVQMQLLNFSKQVAMGLHYLSCKGFVHRDLAARNILVSKDNICKIADFGLSRDLTLSEDDIYVSHGGKIPLKWCAPEAIFRRKYSTASDVWSYGCVLYEIWSLGHKPFESHQSKQVAQLLKKGYRLPPPPGCPKKIFQLMIDTWHPDVSSRPEPRDVLRALIENVNEVMEIPTEDVPVGSQAAVLGAPLNTATHLYTQLQNSYKLTNN